MGESTNFCSTPLHERHILFKVRWVGAVLGGCLVIEETPTKVPAVLWTLGPKGGGGVRARRRKGMGTEPEWGKVSSWFPFPTASPSRMRRLGGGARRRPLPKVWDEDLEMQISGKHKELRVLSP